MTFAGSRFSRPATLCLFLTVLTTIAEPAQADDDHQFTINARARFGSGSYFIDTYTGCDPAQVQISISGPADNAMAEASAFGGHASFIAVGVNSSGAPDAEAESLAVRIVFDDTPALRALFPPFSDTLNVLLNFRASVRTSCVNLCAASARGNIQITYPFGNNSGTHSLIDEGPSGTGFLAGLPPEGGDLVIPIPAAILLVGNPFLPAFTIEINRISTDVDGIAVGSSSSADAEFTLELRDEAGAITLPDGTPLVSLGVDFTFQGGIGPIFADGFESGNISAWSVSLP